MLPNGGLETSRGGLWLGIGAFYGFQFGLSWASWRMTEIVKLKELPKDGFETSRGTLWFGIGTFFGSKLEYHRLAGTGPKS